MTTSLNSSSVKGTSGGDEPSLTHPECKRKRPNCLTKNLLEMDSLPQIRNLLEMREISSAAKVSGGVKDEVNDERKKAHRGGHSRAVSAGAEEREDGNSERVCGVERVRAQLCGAGFAQSRSGGASESAAAGARRCG